ncbi:MAG: MFS transporter, partial [Candidatus Binatia bacterium]
MSRDLFFLIASGAVRNLGFGFYNIIFAIYLSKLGFNTVTIGAVITVSSISGVVQTLVGSILMDRYSRKRVMLFFGVLTFFGSGVMALSSDPILVVIMSGLGLIGARAGGSGAGGMGGPVMVGQVAMLADRTTDRERNMIFAINALALHGSGAVGALMASLPEILQGYAIEEFASYRALFAMGALMSLLYIGLLLGYRERKSEQRAAMGPASEQKDGGRATIIPKESRSFVAKMALLGAIDSFGASLHGSLLSYWFFVVHGASLTVLGPLFAVSNLIGSVTMLIGAKLADRIGNVNATVLTHLPAPLLLMVLPFA